MMKRRYTLTALAMSVLGGPQAFAYVQPTAEVSSVPITIPPT